MYLLIGELRKIRRGNLQKDGVSKNKQTEAGLNSYHSDTSNENQVKFMKAN
jgi:hypothetical protein